MEDVRANPDIQVAQQAVSELWSHQAVMPVQGLQHQQLQFPGFAGEIALEQEGQRMFGPVAYCGWVKIEKMALEPLYADKRIVQSLPIQAQHRGQLRAVCNTPGGNIFTDIKTGLRGIVWVDIGISG